MDNNLPSDPSNPNNNNPPPFGSDFNPYVNPLDPNNPYASSPPPQNPIPQPPIFSDYPKYPESPESPQTDLKDPAQSEVAKHQLRGPDGKFISSEHKVNPEPIPNPSSIPPNPSNPSLPSNPSPDIPKPESNFKKTLNFILQSKTVLRFIIKIKWKVVLGYLVGLIGIISYLFSLPPVKNWAEANFPHNSPLFNREVAHQGILKSSSTGLYTLVLPDGEVYTLHFKPSASLTNLKKLNEVIIKGNLTGTPYVIENAEIFPFNITTDDSDSSPKSSKTLNSSNPSDSSNLPALYPSLTWEITKTKTLIFTSGMRKIEQEGVYLESAQLTSLPQEFINYYTKELSSLGFKQTLNSQEPTGTTITFAKDDLFLTFGVKNIFSGSGDNKSIKGYKAFIEHN